nr:hypothetical protein [Nitrosomonas nitrosa]
MNARPGRMHGIGFHDRNELAQSVALLTLLHIFGPRRPLQQNSGPRPAGIGGDEFEHDGGVAGQQLARLSTSLSTGRSCLHARASDVGGRRAAGRS